jgi:hypothetical protein
MVRPPVSALIVYGVVSASTGKVVEFFRAQRDADAFVATVAADDPEHASGLRVVAFEYSFSLN